MCGICGIISESGAGLEGIEAQLACQRHRGNDATGAFSAGRGAIGQNRLAIVDLELGDPPVTTEDGAIGASLNGEIYNFRSLRRELLRSGHSLRTNGDTEVIAHLAETYEPVELARRLDGMFAFAVWDRDRERLVIGRDRLGKKPLYFWHSADAFVFASEIKGVLAHPAVPRELDPTAIPAYLRFGYVPTPRTFFAGISSLPPGHVLSLCPGEKPLVEPYWEASSLLRAQAESDLGLDEAALELRRLLAAAVERRLISDVPLGAFLSGGIDSSAIVALMAGSAERPVKTFTIGFDDRDGFDERDHARVVAERFGTDHHEFVVEPDAVELIESLVWHHDQPFADSSAIPTFHLSRITRENVTVALAGDGGDELFAGYERFAAALAIARYNRAPAAARRAVGAGLGSVSPRLLGGRVGGAQRFASVADEGLPEAYLAWASPLDRRLADSVLAPDQDWAVADYRSIWRSSEGAPTLDRLLDLNLRTYLLDDLLVKVDRMSMAHALEVRSPFLDVELLSFAAALPPAHKARGLSLKRVLKKAMEGLLPAETIGRRKRGFGVPLDRWFRTDLEAYTSSMLGAQNARVRAHVPPEGLDRVLVEHAAGRRSHGHTLWALLTLEVFLRAQGW